MLFLHIFRADHLVVNLSSIVALFSGKDYSSTFRIHWLPIVLCVPQRSCEFFCMYSACLLLSLYSSCLDSHSGDNDLSSL